MNTLLGTPEVEMRYGWYYCEASNMYEFWWGFNALITLAGEMLDVMPTEAAMEIRASAMVKPDLDALR